MKLSDEDCKRIYEEARLQEMAEAAYHKTFRTRDEIPNEITIKAMEDDKLFTASSPEEMIADALGDPNWENSN